MLCYHPGMNTMHIEPPLPVIIDDFQTASENQLSYFTPLVRDDLSLRRLLKLESAERSLLINLLEHHRKHLSIKDIGGNPQAATLMHIVREELLFGTIWLGISEAEQATIVKEAFSSRLQEAETIQKYLNSAFRKLHAAAWAGELDFVIGYHIYVARMTPEQLEAYHLVKAGLAYAEKQRAASEA